MTNARKTSPLSLLDHARRVARQAEEGQFPDEPGFRVEQVDLTSAADDHASFLDHNSVPRMLGTALLMEALSDRDLATIQARNGVAVVIEVAHSEMVAPVADALRAAGVFSEIFQRWGGSKSQDRPDHGCDKVAGILGGGANVAGVSPAPARYLPSNLTAAADIRLTLGAPTPAAVRTVIALVTGRRVRKLPSLAGLGFLDVCSAIRRNSTAGACARRLSAMVEARRAVIATNSAPSLEMTHGYGEAKEWGLALAAAVEDWRSKGIPWVEAVKGDRAVVLGGPPGTGKSSFAVSLAKSLKLRLHVTSASTWFSNGAGYLGDVVKAITSTFQEASANGPAVLFIDEIDGVPSRDSVDARYRDFWSPVIGCLLQEIESAASSSTNLILIAATNFPERLDPALVRPGRLNRVLRIGLPDADAIVGILGQHLGDEAPPGADLTPLGTLGVGATGADVAGWARAARAAAQAAGRAVTLDDVVRQVCPPETRPPETVRAIARHEASHAVIGEVVASSTLEVVTIVERGSFAGSTSGRLRSNPTMMTAAQIDALAVTQLAGRAADEIWGEPTTGAGGERWSDLAVATNLLASKAASWGLSGSLLYRGDRSEVQALLRDDAQFREAVARDLDRLYSQALRLVRENRNRIERVADRLVERRVLGGVEVRALIADTSPTPVHEADAAEGGPHA
ncbi:AAA family ATPase [Methylobacterium dankookense]|uniref:ATP-dependent zinc metalloprotease FtsH n=1 Tax=Methylobacterium dankookense TaxID=560405 RepID=A0A564FRY6_9HYPH|nr:AAA family ATPase [Methylobacterium dankookense]GJD58085.1 ATP-dependent zinc metalloprotease FtsH [Methylobacterium dankookense]VUF10490.1 ATP-dependent zinc metalloprotease FtsH 2 [Methylobacterium dankookense]